MHRDSGLQKKELSPRYFKIQSTRESLAAQWLGLCNSPARGPGVQPQVGETKIPQPCSTAKNEIRMKTKSETRDQFLSGPRWGSPLCLIQAKLRWEHLCSLTQAGAEWPWCSGLEGQQTWTTNADTQPLRSRQARLINPSGLGLRLPADDGAPARLADTCRPC